jgi:rare lipoprotein A
MNKTTILWLAGMLILFSAGLRAQNGKPESALRAKDSVDILDVPVDSLEIIGNLKFKKYKAGAHASYYSDRFNGRRTASGRRFDNNKYMAAHRKFPFGTKLRLTNEYNGKCVIVEVADRGPFSKGREIDISKRAFREIADNRNSGAVMVTIEVIGL